MSTATALIARLKTRFGDANGDIVTSANWLSYLQECYDYGNSLNPYWQFEEVTDTSVSIAAGANSANLETEQAGAWRVTAVHNVTDAYPLVPIDGSPYLAFPTLASDTGTPMYYRIRKQTLEVYPYADHAVTLQVELWVPPAALVDDSSSKPVWPPEYHAALIDGALSLAYRDDGNDVWADKHWAAFTMRLQKMEEALVGGGRYETYPEIIDIGI